MRDTVLHHLQNQQRRELEMALQLNDGENEEVSDRTLEHHFQDSALEASKYNHVYIILDGLDECDDKTGRRALSNLSALHSKRMKRSIHSCLFSRHHASLEDLMGSQIQIIWLEKENNKDIEHFLHTSMQRMLHPTHETPCVKDAIVKRAAGALLWAKLALDALLQSDFTKGSWEERLYLLSKDLDSLYDAILEGIAFERGMSINVIRRVLTWLSFSLRPLTAGKLKEALLFDPFLEPSLRKEPACYSWDAFTTISQLNDAWLAPELYRGFIEIITKEGYETAEAGQRTGTLQPSLCFIHRTARDFLENYTWKFGHSGALSQSSAHFDVHGSIAVSCLRYISWHYDGDVKYRNEMALHENSKKGFLAYATGHWINHAWVAKQAGFSDVHISSTLELLSKDFTTRQVRLKSSISSKYFKLSDHAGWTAVHACVAFDLHGFISAIFRSTVDLYDIGDSFGLTPLLLAARNGHLSVLKLLISHGANITSTDTKYGAGPLHWACSSGLSDACTELFEAGADVNGHSSTSVPPLGYCSSKKF